MPHNLTAGDVRLNHSNRHVYFSGIDETIYINPVGELRPTTFTQLRKRAEDVFSGVDFEDKNVEQAGQLYNKAVDQYELLEKTSKMMNVSRGKKNSLDQMRKAILLVKPPKTLSEDKLQKKQCRLSRNEENRLNTAWRLVQVLSVSLSAYVIFYMSLEFLNKTGKSKHLT